MSLLKVLRLLCYALMVTWSTPKKKLNFIWITLSLMSGNLFSWLYPSSTLLWEKEDASVLLVGTSTMTLTIQTSMCQRGSSVKCVRTLRGFHLKLCCTWLETAIMEVGLLKRLIGDCSTHCLKIFIIVKVLCLTSDRDMNLLVNLSITFSMEKLYLLCLNTLKCFLMMKLLS